MHRRSCCTVDFVTRDAVLAANQASLLGACRDFAGNITDGKLLSRPSPTAPAD